MAENELYRSESDRVLGGVCGGFSEVYEYDPSIIRILTALMVLVTFPLGLLAYFVAWAIVPTESQVKE